MARRTDDDPVCPDCGYSLTALHSSTCPECGRELGADLSIYRPSRRRTPWSRENPRWLIRGVWDVILHPVRTMEACDDPDRVTTKRAVWFAVLVTGTVILTWPLIRFIAVRTHMLIDLPGLNARLRARGVQMTLGDFLNESKGDFISMMARWPSRTAAWESWSLSRWWILALLLCGLTLVWNRVRPSNDLASSRTLFRRVLLFSPWFVMLDIGFLIGVMVLTSARGLPEPSTLMLTNWDEYFGLGPEWWKRGAIPGLFVWLVFSRGVLAMKWGRSTIIALLLTPVSIYLYICWSYLWLTMRS